jgi:hypothetical protein
MQALVLSITSTATYVPTPTQSTTLLAVSTPVWRDLARQKCWRPLLCKKRSSRQCLTCALLLDSSCVEDPGQLTCRQSWGGPMLPTLHVVGTTAHPHSREDGWGHPVPTRRSLNLAPSRTVVVCGPAASWRVGRRACGDGRPQTVGIKHTRIPHLSSSR